MYCTPCNTCTCTFVHVHLYMCHVPCRMGFDRVHVHSKDLNFSINTHPTGVDCDKVCVYNVQ